MDDEVEIDICCDALLDAIEGGGIQVVEVAPGVYAEAVPDRAGQTGIQMNYCPFCGVRRAPESPDADGTGAPQ